MEGLGVAARVGGVNVCLPWRWRTAASEDRAYIWRKERGKPQWSFLGIVSLKFRLTSQEESLLAPGWSGAALTSGLG